MRRAMRIATATLVFALAAAACFLVYANVKIEDEEILAADEQRVLKFLEAD